MEFLCSNTGPVDLSVHDVTLRLQRCLFAYETSVMKSQASLERARREVTAIAEDGR
jgi:hypothetical protein